MHRFNSIKIDATIDLPRLILWVQASRVNMAAGSRPTFIAPSITAHQNVAANLEGALLISGSLFPYFLLVSLEAGGPLRALLLLLAAPLLRLLELLGLEGAALRAMIFVATAAVRVSDVKAVAKATLPRFFLEDLRDGAAYRAFAGCGGRRYAVTACPRVMAEQFLREYLGVDCVLATELRTFKGFFLGVAAPGGLMTGARTVEALSAATAEVEVVHVGVGRKVRDQPFMSLCAQQYWIEPDDAAQPVPRCDYPKPLIFHDGRLVGRPTPLAFLTVLLWVPLGILLAAFRIFVGLFFPDKLRPMSVAATGMCIRAQADEDEADPHASGSGDSSHALYVCNHRTLLDPVILSAAVLKRKVTAVTYSLSKLSEVISPIPTVRLTRDRFKDGAKMRSLLDHSDLVVCPEGTTCREPYLLRFSPLFAELTDDVFPVAITNEGSMFYGTTVRGHKCWDSFFFLMNPRPFYSLDLLGKVSGGAGRTKYDVANDIQRGIARVTGFECTNLTRKDKYRMIAGHDGSAPTN